MDLITHLPATDYGHDMIYMVLNRLSKFTYFILCKHIVSSADLTLLFLANIVAHYGMPALIISNHHLWFTLHFQYSLIVL